VTGEHSPWWVVFAPWIERAAIRWLALHGLVTARQTHLGDTQVHTTDYGAHVARFVE
jgi:hypothetical protein